MMPFSPHLLHPKFIPPKLLALYGRNEFLTYGSRSVRQGRLHLLSRCVSKKRKSPKLEFEQRSGVWPTGKLALRIFGFSLKLGMILILPLLPTSEGRPCTLAAAASVRLDRLPPHLFPNIPPPVPNSDQRNNRSKNPYSGAGLSLELSSGRPKETANQPVQPGTSKENACFLLRKTAKAKGAFYWHH
jgi:hypothetical protein